MLALCHALQGHGFMVSHGTQQQIGTGGYHLVLSHGGSSHKYACSRTLNPLAEFCLWRDGDLACAAGHGFRDQVMVSLTLLILLLLHPKKLKSASEKLALTRPLSAPLCVW